MASEEAQMQAMMQQMQQMNPAGAGGGGGGAGGMAAMANAMGNGMAGGGRHRKAQSNASLSIIDLQAKQMEVDPMTEIQDYHAEKELLLKAYDDIDLDDNGDIEWNEFESGMQRLNVNLNDAEVKQVFKLMDSDSSNFVDRNEFTMFLSQRFESMELTRYQDAILQKIGGRSRKSGAVTGGDDMTDVSIAAMERAMRKEMNEMTNTELVILKEEEKLYQDLEKQEEEQQDFGEMERANDWNRFEVAHWMDVEVKLSEYMTTFMKAHVDGSILLSDLGETYLVSELGIKRVHVAKIMRAIVELRDAIRKEWDEVEPWDIISYPNNYLNDDRATDRITYLEGELTARDEEILNLKKEYESRIQSLIGQIEEKEAIIKEAEKDGFILNDDDDDENTDDYNTDSADITDEDMPPLIDAMAHQQTINYFPNDENHNMPEQQSQIQERNSVYNNENESEEKKDINENETDNIADNASEKRHSMVMSGDEQPIDAMTTTTDTLTTPKIDATLAADVIDKMISQSPSPNLTPSSSQQRLHQAAMQKSASAGPYGAQRTPRKHRHHRKNSTKTGFWAQNHGKKKPPAGTKAYWLYLDQKASNNGNFANPIRIQSWHHHEIAYWLKQIKCDKYAVKFVDEKVSGEQLIYDMNSSVLSSDLGVKMLHCGKIMREIESLKITAGITFCVQEKVTNDFYRPSEEESVTKKMENYEHKLQDMEGKHEEELKEKDEKYNELMTENDTLKQEVEGLEKQVVELEKRKAKKSEYDSDDDDSEQEEEQQQETPQNDTENKQEENTETNTETLAIETEKLAITKDVTKRPKGYFRKYPKEIRKLMREIDDMERKSNDGLYGNNNIGKFAATNRAFKWKKEEVCWWLDKSGFMNYISSFHSNGIDGEILVNDLNPTILHQDLSVKRFHTGKMLREIQILRQGGEYSQCDNIIDIEYKVQFSASEAIETLNTENKSMSEKLQDSEAKINELISRPQIEEHQKIVEIKDWDGLVAEKERLAAQVDEYEEKIDDIKNNAIPQQEANERKGKLNEFINSLQEMKSNNKDTFANVINVRQWNTNEVCWFFMSIGLSDYCGGLREQTINGEILIEDFSAELLSRDIGVKRIHINQILRQVDDLKHKAFGYEEDDDVCNINYVPEIYATELNESFEKKINELEQEIKSNEMKYNELNEKYDALNTEKEGLSTEKQELLAQMDTLNENIIALKNQQQLDLEDSAKSQIDALNVQIEGLNKNISDNETLYEQEKETKQMETQEILTQKEGVITELNEKISELETNLNSAQDSILEFEDKERIAREEEEAKDNSYEAQLRRKARDDATFCLPKLAHRWTIEEVSHWLYTLKVGEYVDTFKTQLVDGSMLLSDLSAEQLRSDLNIKQYHIGKITREIAKLKTLATPPLSESEIFLCSNEYVPDKPAVDTIAELKHELHDQQDINSALNMEVQNLKDQYETIKEIQAMNSEMAEQTAGGPNENQNQNSELKEEELAQSSQSQSQSNKALSNEEIEKLTKENAQLNEMLDYLAKSKMDLAMRTATEMQTLRDMVRVASQAYEELTGTPFGQVANWPATQNFFYNTLGMTPNKKPPNDKHWR